MLITPMETNGYFRGNKPPEKQGEQHIDGHVNFFTPSSYVKLLEESGLRIIDGCLMYSVVPPGAFEALMPEHKTQTWLDTLSSPKKMLERAIHKFPGIPWEWKRSLVGGGIHISICRSKVC